MAMHCLSSSSPLLNGQFPGTDHIFTYSKNKRKVQKWACNVKIGGPSKHWRCKYIIRNALPDVTTTMMVVFVVGAATTILVKQTETKRSQPKQNKCEACNGSGLCGECNGEGFILKKLSKDASDKARKNAKDVATRYTAGLPKKWNYCSNCSGSQRCLVCNGRGIIQEI
ncbi:hypothetical protein SUGI_0742450 [Cryptomeria japonica]|uniref:uncharacterized protein LOC131065744 n=1 Tax=Cryptomeria japonica TaxID=3369 RepID=UPI002414BD7B|nr:uncharacterized protein LOC131065744 [Cryptomeria japonica]GLJ36806.1 hypothetical protein SUGI_0742450 [Cryptomeria japonica]